MVCLNDLGALSELLVQVFLAKERARVLGNIVSEGYEQARLEGIVASLRALGVGQEAIDRVLYRAAFTFVDLLAEAETTMNLAH